MTLTLLWTAGLLRRRLGRLLAVSLGIAVAVALIGSLGSFLTTSQATMTSRALRSVAVDWQVQVAPGADPAAVLATVRHEPGTRTAVPVRFAPTAGLQATSGGSTQSTGAGVVLGLPTGYDALFPGAIRLLSGSLSGVLVAQQTASNLHVRPGDPVTVQLAGRPTASVRVAGVVDLPQSDSLFQRVGAPATSQPTAPPDNVVLLPDSLFASVVGAGSPGAPTTTQVHVRRDAPTSSDPAAAYVDVTGAAHHLEAVLAGAGVVGNNVGAALSGARGDAAYAQLLFLFLGVPGAVVAALLTGALVGGGAQRRREEQALLRTRGVRPGVVASLAGMEALVVGVVGGVAGVLLALAASRWAFGALQGTVSTQLAWYAVAFASGMVVSALVVLTPAARDLRSGTVAAARLGVGRARRSWWRRTGLDLLLLAASGVVFWMSSRDNYTLVLAPEGVATIAVSYWAFLGPVLFWLGAGLLLWRLATLGLAHGRRPLAWAIAPLAGRMAEPAASSMSRLRRPLTRSIVLLALAVSFAVSTASFNATYQRQAEADAQLTNGADVTVTPNPAAAVGATSGSHPDAAAMSQIAGVVHVEPIQHRFAYVGADLQDLYGVHPGSITSATSLQDAYFQGGTAASLMATLAARPDGLLVSDETVKDFQLQPGDLVNLRLPVRSSGTSTRLSTVPFHYVGIVKEFPTAPKDSFFVANADYVARATGNPSVGAFLVSTDGSTSATAAVAAHLRSQWGADATVTDVAQTRLQVGSSLTSVNLAGLTRLELAFAVVLAVGAGGLVLVVGLVERRRTLALLSVLGARRRQLTGVVLSEAVLVGLFGILGGALMAWGLSEMLVKVLTGVFDPPPARISVPWTYLGATVVAVTAALAAAALAQARQSTRPALEELRDS